MKKYVIFFIIVFFGFLYIDTLFATPNTWTQRANFGGDARMNAVALYCACSNGYVGLGMVPCGYFDDFWEYNASTDTWTQRKEFGGGPRAAAAGFSTGSKNHFVGTGEDDTSTLYKDFWKYEPPS